MEELKIQNLIYQYIAYFQSNCYTENHISKYKNLWRTGIIHYMSEHDIADYSPSVGANFIATCHIKE